MRQVGSWFARAGVGFVRACTVAAVTMLVPGVWAAAVALGIWWGPANPWSWVAPFVLVCLGTLALSRPVCRMVRHLVRRWTTSVIPDGYRPAPQVVRMSTGYWWNGFSYERSRRDAVMDQRWRLRYTDPATWRDLRFTVIAPFTAGLIASLPPVGAAAALLWLGRPGPGAGLLGAAGVVVAVASAPYAWRPLEPVAVRFLRPSRAAALTDRVDELTAQRANATVAQAAELRRIERDLHDGAQARLVALGLSLATAEKLMENDPDRARTILREARAGASASLAELRELVRGISPPVLTERGLVDAVRALALDIPLDTHVDADLRRRPEPPVESALYFGIAELLTNAVKHAHASRARVSIAQHADHLVVEVEDDGRGAATMHTGGGLAGLRRRLTAFDGTVEITSPAGGPTRIRMAVPCESS
ncbi:sensor histidine kinase [Micromonospora sp. 15K316]|uniref:sensor histidine kinase n=1 Tax=Micromonospora sp. 15K316 TaxID=2530376 RepID=UPI00104F66E3|nr:sensor histidine kinase [Micromonospora sp. 15K316]TDC28751.1 sensor histidine kinase [Micromonospora sp. 15K316]